MQSEYMAVSYKNNITAALCPQDRPAYVTVCLLYVWISVCGQLGLRQTSIPISCLCVCTCAVCSMLLASISVVVSKWVLAKGRSCGSQQNYVQVRDALYGTNPYYRTISLGSCCTLTEATTRKQEVVSKCRCLLMTHKIIAFSFWSYILCFSVN